MSATPALLLLMMLASGAQAKQSEDVCKAYTIMREAGSESKRSKRAVLDVLQHRMRKKHKSCRAVVAEKHQFSWYRRNIAMKVTPRGLQDFRSVARMAPVLRNCAEWFHSGQQPSWARKKHLVHREERLKFYC